MSVSKKFRNVIAAATALTATTVLPGCGTAPVDEHGLPVGKSSYGFVVPNYTKEELTTKVTHVVNGQPTEAYVEERQVILRERTLLQQSTDFIGGITSSARDISEGQAARDFGRGAKAYGEGVKNGQLKPGDYINNETTTLGQTTTQNPTLTSDPTLTATQNPTLTATQNPTLTATQNPNISNDSSSTSGATAGAAAGATAGASATQAQNQWQAQQQQQRQQQDQTLTNKPSSRSPAPR